MRKEKLFLIASKIQEKRGAENAASDYTDG